VTIHDLDADQPGSGGEHLVDLSGEAGEVGRQDGWGDEVVDREIQARQTPLPSTRRCSV
jgi:hypothetical protein